MVQIHPLQLLYFREGTNIIPITKNEAQHLSRLGYKYKSDIIRTLNGRSYFLKESDILIKKLREYRGSKTVEK